MSLFEEAGRAIGKAMGGISELMIEEGKNATRDIIREGAHSVEDAIPEMNNEIAVGTINEDMFRTEEVKKLTRDLKERVKSSPEGVADWFNDTLGDLFGGFHGFIVGAIVPSKIESFEDADNAAGYMMFIAIDVVVLIGILDMIATAFSLTLVRNIVHIGRLFMGTFGFDRLAAATIQPAVSAGVMQYLEQGYNQRYQAQIPGSGDLVRFALREVWDPQRREELLTEIPGGDYYDLMEKRGFKEEHSNSFWAAHWVLPSVGQLNEMLHRRVIDPSTWDRFVKYNDFDPLVRPWLKAISYNPYTRVDVRRMWDLRIVSEDEVFNNYLDLGYDEEHAQKMTLWTKVYVLATELRARYSKGWISEDDVRNALLNAGMPSDRVEEYLQKFIKDTGEERTQRERDLTKAEVVKGVKKGLISWDEGIAMLVDLGYSEAEADYILTINIEAGGGSPETWSEFQAIVNKRRSAVRVPVKEIPEEIRVLEAQITKYEKVRKLAQEAGEDREFFAELDRRVNPLKRDLRRAVKKFRGG
jgi:hypothetical protein